jgi:hypothetical protein
MKKALLLFACFIFLTSVRAEKGDELSFFGNYTIVSDEISLDVPAGKCMVKGIVMGPQRDTAAPMPVNGGTILTADGSKQTVTDQNGSYQLLLDENDSLLYFYLDGLTEIVVSGFDFKSQHKVTINFFPWFQYGVNVVDKPVIYCYSQDAVNAEITFSCIGDLTLTYPKYNGNWKVAVKDNSITDRKTGKTYPYLFWESQTQNLQFERSSEGLAGFVIHTDTAVGFLEKSLTLLGLTSTEQTDFITYWVPKLVQSEYVFIQFWIDDLYEENISQMTITPTPDAMRRVFMVYAPLETTIVPAPVRPQKLETFERKSFTVVEWGGSELQPPVLMP